MKSKYLEIIKNKLNSYYNPHGVELYRNFTCNVPTDCILTYIKYHKEKTLYHYSTIENCEKIVRNGFIGHIIDNNTEYFSRCLDLKNLEKSFKEGILYAYSDLIQPTENNKYFSNFHCMDFVSRRCTSAIKFDAECIEIYHHSDNQIQFIFDISSVRNMEIIYDPFDLSNKNITVDDMNYYRNFISDKNKNDDYKYFRNSNSIKNINIWFKEFLPMPCLMATHKIDMKNGTIENLHNIPMKITLENEGVVYWKLESQ